jgi:two-component system, NtrC family, nitrogen regulation sensor histidine kinase NtrY
MAENNEQLRATQKELANELNPNSQQETRKRKREVALVLFLGILLLFLTWFEFKLASISQQLPFYHSIFFFGLVNFNIILILLLFFLVFRNIVKVFVERRGKLIGSSLKSKLIIAFGSFSSIPTALMLLIFVFYINSSLDKWFSVRSTAVLKNSLEVNQEYILTAKKKNYHFANQIAKDLKTGSSREAITKQLEQYRDQFALDAVEYYPSLFGQRSLVLSKDESIPEVPPPSLEFLKKGLSSNSEGSTIQEFAEGNLVRVIVPIEGRGKAGAIVVSSFIPFSLISKMDDISAAYENLRNFNPLQSPLRSIYLIILILMTLVILMCATWFGFYLARQLSIPLESLGLASRRVSQGDYQPVAIVSGSSEINQLIENFNQMIANLDRSKREVLFANKNLTETLERLDEHSRYVQVVLSSVTTGVISVDQHGNVTTINRHAGQLLNIDPDRYIGRHIRTVVDEKYYTIFRETLKEMHRTKTVNKDQEVKVDIGGRTVPLQMNVSLLLDEKGNDLGSVVVFDDLTPLVAAQRAAAWTEVARRIAHEIKNPLTPIKLSAQRLEKKFGSQVKDPAFSSCINMIIKQTDELKALVNEFSQFARLPQAQPLLGSLNKTVEEALFLFQTGHKEISFSFEPDLSLPEFKFDPEQIKRALTNLLDNSVAAVQENRGARVSIRTQYDSLLKIARVAILDNGVGIPESNRARIFEPYFSTKEHGTGLGLAIVRRIVEDHNGFIRALSNEPQGTKIIIELPVNVTEVVKPANQEFSNG